MEYCNEEDKITLNNIDIDKNLLFLFNLKDEMNYNREGLLEKIKCNNIELNDMKKSLSILNRNNDENIELFSLIANSNCLKVETIKERMNLLQFQIIRDEDELLNIISKIDSIEDIIAQISIKNNYNNSKNIEIESTMDTKEIEQCRNLDIIILENQELDRKRIARDLHDSTVQNLTSIVHKADLCTKLVDVDNIRIKLELQTMISTLRSTINGMRSIIFDLRPMLIDELGLVLTIEKYVYDLNSSRKTFFEFKIKNDELRVLPIVNLTIFRIIQEACSNIIKHSNAEHADILISYLKEGIEIIIKDNGIGFNVDLVRDKNRICTSSYGLSIMQERIYLLSGILKISSKEGIGTEAYAYIPYSTCGGISDESN